MKKKNSVIEKRAAHESIDHLVCDGAQGPPVDRSIVLLFAQHFGCQILHAHVQRRVQRRVRGVLGLNASSLTCLCGFILYFRGFSFHVISCRERIGNSSINSLYEHSIQPEAFNIATLNFGLLQKELNFTTGQELF